MPRIALYTFMALHAGVSSASYIFGKAAAVGFEDPAVLTLARALGAAATSRTAPIVASLSR